MLKGRQPEKESWIGLIMVAVFMIIIGYLILNADFSSMLFGEIKTVTDSMESSNEIPNERKFKQNSQELVKPPEVKNSATVEHEKPTEEMMFRYTDENGIMVMGNNIENVPMRYRTKMKVLKTDSTNNLKTSVIVNNNRIFVPVKITYKGRTENIKLLVDTGATGINISQRVAALLKISPTDGHQGESILADGRRIPTLFTKADYVSVGPKTLTNAEIQVMMRERNEDDGLLGMAFLGEFPHTIDLKTQTIKWH